MNRKLRVVLAVTAVSGLVVALVITLGPGRVLAKDGDYDNWFDPPTLGNCWGIFTDAPGYECVSPTYCHNVVPCERQSFPNCPVKQGGKGSGMSMRYQKIESGWRKQYGGCDSAYGKTCYAKCVPDAGPPNREGKILCTKALLYRYGSEFCATHCWSYWLWLSPANKCLWLQNP